MTSQGGAKRAIVGFSAVELKAEFVKDLRRRAEEFRLLSETREYMAATREMMNATATYVDEVAEYWEGVEVKDA